MMIQDLLVKACTQLPRPVNVTRTISAVSYDLRLRKLHNMDDTVVSQSASLVGKRAFDRNLASDLGRGQASFRRHISRGLCLMSKKLI